MISLSLIFATSSCEEVADVLAEEDEKENTNGNSNNSNTDSDDTSKPSSEVESAFQYLNEIRVNPSKYAGTITQYLSSVEARPKLNWNESLAKAAQMKAEDMASRNYFSHTTPEGYGMNYYINYYGYELPSYMLASVDLNYFESIAAGSSTGKDAIDMLINDGGADNESAGHRRHLLGIHELYAKCYDIGIGMAYNPNSTYKYYWSFLVAAHSFN